MKHIIEDKMLQMHSLYWKPFIWGVPSVEPAGGTTHDTILAGNSLHNYPCCTHMAAIGHCNCTRKMTRKRPSCALNDWTRYLSSHVKFDLCWLITKEVLILVEVMSGAGSEYYQLCFRGANNCSTDCTPNTCLTSCIILYNLISSR